MTSQCEDFCQLSINRTYSCTRQAEISGIMEGGARVHRCVVHFVLNLSEHHCDDQQQRHYDEMFFFSLQPIRSLKIQLTSSKETAVHAFILSTQRCGGSHLHTTSKITTHSFKAAHCTFPYMVICSKLHAPPLSRVPEVERHTPEVFL